MAQRGLGQTEIRALNAQALPGSRGPQRAGQGASETLFVDVLAARGMLQPRIHADGLAHVFAGLVPQIYQVIVLVVLPFELPGGVDEEKRTG